MGQLASRACCSGPEAESPELEPYGDISGIGVIIGFVGTGYFVLLLMILSYLVSYDPTQSPWPGEEERYRWHANPIDVMFLRWIRRIKPTDPNPFRGPASRLQRSIDKSILALCDVQLVTGLGILTCAFILGAQCKLDAYHWQMAVHLAWFSVVTHLSGLSALRNYIAQSRWPKYARVGIMASLLAILLAATVPTIFFDWAAPTPPVSAAQPKSRAICFLDLDYGVQRYRQSRTQPQAHDVFGVAYPEFPSLQYTFQFQAAVFSIILLVFGFTSRFLKLFGVLSRSSNLFIRAPLSWLGKHLVRQVTSRQSRWPFGLWEAAVQQPILAIFIMLRMAVNLVSSMLAELYWLLCVVLWGNVKLIGTRASAGEDIVKEEDEWAFGQILPVLLLAGPFIVISGNIASDFYKARASASYARLRSPERISLDSLNIRTQADTDRGPDQVCPDGAAPIIHTEANHQNPDISTVDQSCHDSPIPSSHKDLEFWLEPKSSMQHSWIALCLIMPSLLVLAITLVFFTIVYPFYDLRPYMGLTDFWILRLGFLFTFLVDFPLACTATVLVALRLNPLTPGQPRNSSRRFNFCWLCMASYTICCASTLLVVLMPVGVGNPVLLRPYVFPFVKIFLYYLLYVVGLVLSSILGLRQH